MYNKEKQAFIYIALEIILIIPYLCVPHNMPAAVCCPHALDVSRKHPLPPFHSRLQAQRIILCEFYPSLQVPSSPKRTLKKNPYTIKWS